MESKLVRRIVSNDQSRRISVYLRNDGLFSYSEERVSEWDDAPPAWIEVDSSGIFYSAAEAVIEAREATPWLASAPQSTDSTVASAKELPEKWRPRGVRESLVVEKLLSADFAGRDELVIQLKEAMVMRIDANGSLRFRGDGPFANVAERVAVEGFYCDDVNGRGALVHLLLHVVDGRLHELEIYKEDGSPILIDPYEIEASLINFY